MKIFYIVGILFLFSNYPVWGGDNYQQVINNAEAIKDLEVRTDWQNEDRLRAMQQMGADFAAMRQDGAEVVRILKEEQVAAMKERQENAKNTIRVTAVLTAVKDTLGELKADSRVKDARDDDQDESIAILDERSKTNRWWVGAFIPILAATGFITRFFTRPKKKEPSLIIKP